MIFDTGASTDILDEIALAHINQKNNITLQPSSKCLLAYRSTNQLAVTGQFESTISFENRQCNTLLHVLKGDNGSLLSCKTATALGIVNLQVSHICEGVCKQWTGLLGYWTDLLLIRIIELSVFLISAASTTATNYNNAYGALQLCKLQGGWLEKS